MVNPVASYKDQPIWAWLQSSEGKKIEDMRKLKKGTTYAYIPGIAKETEFLTPEHNVDDESPEASIWMSGKSASGKSLNKIILYSGETGELLSEGTFYEMPPQEGGKGKRKAKKTRKARKGKKGTRKH